MNEGNTDPFNSISGWLKLRRIAPAILASIAATLLFFMPAALLGQGAPLQLKQPGAQTPAYNPPDVHIIDASKIVYSDGPIPDATSTILGYMGGSFGALVMAVSLICALVCAFIGVHTKRRGWKETAVLFMIVAVLAFCARSLAEMLLVEPRMDGVEVSDDSGIPLGAILTTMVCGLGALIGVVGWVLSRSENRRARNMVLLFVLLVLLSCLLGQF